MSVNTDEIEIRYYNKIDRPAVRRISYETSFLGHADELFDEPELVADALTMYFTDNEPESCFVAVYKNQVIGYLIGARDESKMSKISWIKVYPRLFFESIARGLFFRRKTLRFVRAVCSSFFRSEFHSPDFSKEFPAIFHINILKEFRGAGVGRKLVDFYLQYLSQYSVEGVRVSVMSDSAKAFFENCGFCSLFMRPRSYLRYYLGKDIQVYLLGKIL